MTDLYANRYNSRLSRDRQKLKLWRYAGLMLTYRCTAACRFCYYYCRPEAEGLLPIETALSVWTSLRMLAGPAARIHITGGEPFLYFDHLADLLREARRRDLPPLDSLETNGSWATSEIETRQKLRLLRDLDVRELKISCDPFHAEFIDVELIRKLRALAVEILGPDRVRVRWEKYLEHPLSFDALSAADSTALARQILREDRCRFTGRAAEQIAPLVADMSIEQIAALNCKKAILDAKGVHIDPAGNVFSGQCSGTLLGDVHTTALELLWQEFDPSNQPFWSVLFEFGPAGLLAQATSAGYKPLPKYASKCHLCSDIRRFFFDKGIFLSIIGPKACYGL